MMVVGFSHVTLVPFDPPHVPGGPQLLEFQAPLGEIVERLERRCDNCSDHDVLFAVEFNRVAFCLMRCCPHVCCEAA